MTFSLETSVFKCKIEQEKEEDPKTLKSIDLRIGGKPRMCSKTEPRKRDFQKNEQ